MRDRTIGPQVDPPSGGVVDGYTVVPLAMRWDKGKVKVTLGIAKGKKSHDKRDTIKDRDWQRQRARMMSSRR